MPKLAPGLFVACALTLSGCQSALGGGVDAFNHADYPQAARELRRAATLGLNPEDVGRHDLYAGLTHLALGNAELAIVHLSRARLALDANPKYFSNVERAQLLTAWRAMGRMPGQALVSSRP